MLFLPASQNISVQIAAYLHACVRSTQVKRIREKTPVVVYIDDGRPIAGDGCGRAVRVIGDYDGPRLYRNSVRHGNGVLRNLRSRGRLSDRLGLEGVILRVLLGIRRTGGIGLLQPVDQRIVHQLAYPMGTEGRVLHGGHVQAGTGNARFLGKGLVIVPTLKVISHAGCEGKYHSRAVLGADCLDGRSFLRVKHEEVGIAGVVHASDRSARGHFNRFAAFKGKALRS